MPEISPCLWFDTDGLEAAEHYVSIFPDSRIVEVVPYSEAGRRPAGSVMVVSFELDGTRFVALNGGPQFHFSEAVSFQIDCRTQEEVDHYWERLGDGGEHGPCGWLKDRFGVSWQVVPVRLKELLSGDDPQTVARVTEAMMAMGKLEIAPLEEAAAAGAQATR